MDNAVDWSTFEPFALDLSAVDIVVMHFAHSLDSQENYHIDYYKIVVVWPAELVDTFEHYHTVVEIVVANVIVGIAAVASASGTVTMAANKRYLFVL